MPCHVFTLRPFRVRANQIADTIESPSHRIPMELDTLAPDLPLPKPDEDHRSHDQNVQ